MHTTKLTELQSYDPQDHKMDAFLYVVGLDKENNHQSLKISVGDLFGYMGITTNCQYCSQPTFKDRPCLYCGGAPTENFEQQE